MPLDLYLLIYLYGILFHKVNIRLVLLREDIKQQIKTSVKMKDVYKIYECGLHKGLHCQLTKNILVWFIFDGWFSNSLDNKISYTDISEIKRSRNFVAIAHLGNK